MRAAGRVHVGCSGWQYAHWREAFYPAGLPLRNWFAHYATVFDTVEINNSFYRLPPDETFVSWREQAPSGFVYAVKASRYLTHMKKLKDPEEPLHRLLSRARHLGPHLGPILYQLPPRWAVDLERFEGFLKTLRRVSRQLRINAPHAVEFREVSWYDDRVFALMEQHQVALCLHDMQGAATDRVVIGPCVYVRYHFGTRRYGGRYDDRRLATWAEWLAERAASGLDVYAYFNNDEGGHAPRDAVRLRSLIDDRLGSVGADAGDRRLPRAV
jgi:uncharacterized protein YecE (DUF72 family)